VVVEPERIERGALFQEFEESCDNLREWLEDACFGVLELGRERENICREELVAFEVAEE
jgi:hypothetical protein